MKKIPFVFCFVFLCNVLQSQNFVIKNLKINDEHSQFGLMFYNNNDVYFSAPVLNQKNIKRKKENKPQLFSLFQGKKTKTGEIVNVKLFNEVKKTSFNSTSAVISADGKYMYLTTNYSSKKDTYKLKEKSYNLFIVRAEHVEGKGWTNFTRLPFCDPNYSFGHPAISPDGQTLYFVSNLPSAKGPTDIFKVDILDDNHYSKPENLGDVVNSVRKEMFPFVDANDVLYISSDRAFGIGGLDIYKVEKDSHGNYKKPLLMEAPINSKYDDFAFIYKSARGEGYFSSKRPGGKGEDDIYYVTLLKEGNSDFLVTTSSSK